MVKQLLISLAPISFSVVSTAAAIPMDADQALLDATPNAVLHREVVSVQGGDSDKDVAGYLTAIALEHCRDDGGCDKASKQNVAIGDRYIYSHQTIGDWFVQDNPGGWHSLGIWLIAIAAAVFPFSRKSTSTK